ncbi:MAG: DUF2975 domain-containing protein [Actinomycetes bacterium]
MEKLTITVLRIVIAIALVGSLLVQVVMVPLLWIDLEGAPGWFRVAMAVIAVLGVATLQVAAVCIWILLTKVRRGSVFSFSSFRPVNVIIGTIAAAAILTFALAVVLAPTTVAPGIVGLLCGMALVIAGVALLMVVMRALLAQAVDREVEAGRLRSELDGVI